LDEELNRDSKYSLTKQSNAISMVLDDS